ncbi:MAG: hypothetical protein KatS3mg027_2648 [Bacteroidia bacterium]|nr:MAG: hypothetical protein KatS3mg027_2648 [Bacteroidia bacterium]
MILAELLTLKKDEFMRYEKALIIFGVFLFFQKSNAQIGEGGIPPSFGNSSCISQNSIDCIHFPIQDNNALLIADSLSNANDTSGFLSFNFGITLQANYNIFNTGTWEYLPDSSRLWRLHLNSPTAYSNYLIFDEFIIPPGAKLFAYNNDHTQILGAFTSKNNRQDGRFSLGPIIGNSVILEYYEPKNTNNLTSINIIAFIHSFKDVFTHTIGTSGGCNINVKCPEGNGWCNQRRSVALISKLSSSPGHFAAICSGSLITNEKRDGRPYFLTAFHCLDNNKDGSLSNQEKGQVADWIFIFNYQSQDCSTPNSAPPTTFSISGAIYRAGHSNSDFSLLELFTIPIGSYNTYYSGWNNKNERPKNGVGIHHPSGDIKKISVYSKKPKRKPVDGIKVWELEFDNGVVEPGSSGSPLFNENNLIVGQLLGTYANDPISCSNTDGKALYGRFDISWDDKSGADNQLKPWLSPNSTSNFYIQSMSGEEPCKPSYYFQNANDLHTSANINGLNNPGSAGSRTYNGVYMSSGTIETGQNVTIQSSTSVEFYGETIILGPGFTANAGSSFIASPQPCLRGCNTGVGKVGSFDVENEEAFITLGYDRSEQEENDEDEDSIVPNNQSLNPIIISGNILLFPNPTSGKFTLQTSSNFDEKYSVKIFDYTGKLIYSENNIINSTLNIDLSGNTKGVYLINIIQGNKIYIEKLIIR